MCWTHELACDVFQCLLFSPWHDHYSTYVPHLVLVCVYPILLPDTLHIHGACAFLCGIFDGLSRNWDLTLRWPSCSTLKRGRRSSPVPGKEAVEGRGRRGVPMSCMSVVGRAGRGGGMQRVVEHCYRPFVKQSSWFNFQVGYSRPEMRTFTTFKYE